MTFPLFFRWQSKEFRAFELLRSGLDRSKYLLVKEAKIIAMTCTHAALKRHDLVELGFKVHFHTADWTMAEMCSPQLLKVLVLNYWLSLLVRQHPDGRGRSDSGDWDLHPPLVTGNHVCDDGLKLKVTISRFYDEGLEFRSVVWLKK